MNIKPKLSSRDKRLISFFFSVIFLSAFFSFVGDITHEMFYTSSTVQGMVSDYTSDSVYVYVPWKVQYEHTKNFTEVELLEMKVYINNLMKKDIKYLINTTTYDAFIILSKDKSMISNNGITIIIFNN